ncbi:hypothetical protein U1Q18_025848 [Sarracenia purpurea var. burkii]
MLRLRTENRGEKENFRGEEMKNREERRKRGKKKEGWKVAGATILSHQCRRRRRKMSGRGREKPVRFLTTQGERRSSHRR